MSLKFKNRIALFNTLTAASCTTVAFVVIYFVVYVTAYRHLDGDITSERDEVFKMLRIEGDSIFLETSAEWKEKEHEQVEVHPTFLQIRYVTGAVVFLSPNMKTNFLPFVRDLDHPSFKDNVFNNERIRQGQFPITNASGKIIGHLTVGVSQAESVLVLKNLALTLIIAFLVLSLVFYFVSSFAAAQGIAPINQLIDTAEKIDDQNIHTRLPLPTHEDEIYNLATTINELLDRIEGSLRREKQITADISHELRTPLAGIRGTLEVLLRKRRDPEQYEQKMEQVLQETDRMNKMLEQLLQLSRIEAGIIQPNKEAVDLTSFFKNFLSKWQPILAEKQTVVKLQIAEGSALIADSSLLELMMANLLSNALKYGPQGGKVEIAWDAPLKELTVRDNGPGIPKDQLPYLFDRFYRTDISRNSKIPGTGLGLSIAKKLADLQGIALSVKSESGQGATFMMRFA